jgi:hypothetical protein
VGCLIQTAIDFRLHAALTKRKITLNRPGIRGMSVKMCLDRFGRSRIAHRRSLNSTSKQHDSSRGNPYQHCGGSSGQKAVSPLLHVTQYFGTIDHGCSLINGVSGLNSTVTVKDPPSYTVTPKRPIGATRPVPEPFSAVLLAVCFGD